MFERHPNLSEEINNHLAESELLGGAWLAKMCIGDQLHVQTQNTLYLIEMRTDGFYISGNPEYCPKPTPCQIHGSTWGGSMLKVGFIGRGMHLEFSTAKYRVILTSEIKEVRDYRPGQHLPEGKAD